MKIVTIESPFAGDVERNLRYVRAAMRDSILRGEAPFASHALYTQEGVLDDDIPDERLLGIDVGFRFKSVADLTAVYTDLGISDGMRKGIDASLSIGCPVEYRTIEGWRSTSSQLPKTQTLSPVGNKQQDYYDLFQVEGDYDAWVLMVSTLFGRLKEIGFSTQETISLVFDG